jgi:hypothetical protein
MNIRFPAVFALLLLVGCSHFVQPAREHELETNKQYWIDYDASRRGTFFFKDDQGKYKTCAEPSPDVAYKLTEKLEAMATYASVDAKGKADFNRDVVNLAERTQMIMFLREALFRLCELTMNSDLEPTAQMSLYQEVLEAALNLAKSEADRGEALKLEEQRKLQELKLKTGSFMENLESNPTP